jgi:NADH:ubiquinone oxidoreductase subunit 5 (subunit L)/multisubunit Na+/H+ antiporter MnhA subunit
MGLSIGVAVLGIGLAVLMYLKNVLSAENMGKRAGFLYDWSLNKYYFDENYDKYLYQPTLRLAKKISWIDWELYDKYFINGFGRVTAWASRVSGKFDYDIIDQLLVDGFGRIADNLGSILKKVQTGKLQNYLLYVTVGIIILMIIQSF